MRPMAASCRRSRRALIWSTCGAGARGDGACGQSNATWGRRRERGAGPDRRADRRQPVRQGDRDRAAAIRRGQPSGGARADRTAARAGRGRRWNSRICCCWCRRALPVRGCRGGRAVSRGWARRSTMPPARRSTRWRKLRGWAGRAGRRWSGWRRRRSRRFAFPRPMLGREGCDFSFSGLKTAVAGRWRGWGGGAAGGDGGGPRRKIPARR